MQVLYSSATGATEPNNLAYMTRIGYFGYDNMQQFLRSINDMGLGAMEMLAMSLKVRRLQPRSSPSPIVCRALAVSGTACCS